MVEQLTRKQVAENNSRKSAWFVIGNKVYDVTKFLDEHPGGCEVLLEQAGSDATESFEDVGHSTDARHMKDEYLVGELVPEEHQQYSYDKRKWNAQPGDNKQRTGSDSNPLEALIMPIFVAVIVALLYYLFTN